MALVYEYMSLGSLYSHLQRDGGCPLSWVQRLKICIGVARGLEYLHNGLGTGFHVIHRDIKSSNILLDQNWEPKIADFGLSMISPLSFITTHVAGTIGYVDPHYCKTGILTKASDLYSFGIVLLELLCGRVACKMDTGLDDDDKRDLARWARACIAQGTLDQIIDSRLRGQIMPESFSEFTNIVSRCVHIHPEERPTITQVLKSLEFTLDLQLQDSQRNSLQPAGIMTLQTDPSEKSCSTTLTRPPKKSSAKSIMKRFFNNAIGGRSGTENVKYAGKTNTRDEKSHSVSSIFKEPRTSSSPLPRLTCATSQLSLPSSTTSTLSSQVEPEVPTQVPDVSSSIVTSDKIQGSPTVVSECSASPLPNLTISVATSAPIVMPPENCKWNKVLIGGVRVQEEYEKIWTKILSLHPDILSNIRVGSDMIKSAAAEEVCFLISTIAGRSAMELDPSLLDQWTSKLKDLEFLGVDVEPLKKKQKEMTLLIDEIRERKDREENTRTVEACRENLERARAEFEEAQRLYEKCVKDMEIANTKSTTLRDRLKERCDALCVDSPAAIDISKDLAEEYM